MDYRTRDRRSRNTFWIDDRVVDDFAPVMSEYPFGAAALAVYIVLARRADREGDSWPRLELIAAESGASARTVQRAVRLLEVLGLVEVARCYEQGSNRQTSNLYTLLTPPDPLPEIDPDPEKWPAPQRRTVLVRGANRAESVAAARVEQGALAGLGPNAGRPGWAPLQAVGEGPQRGSERGAEGVTPGEPPRQADTLPPVRLTPPPRQADTPPTSHSHPPHVRMTPLEGNTFKDNTRKERPPARKDGEKRDGVTRRVTAKSQTASDDVDRAVSPSGRLAVLPSFVIAEVGLSNRQVWAATLGELARRGDVGRADLESWLRPAGLIGRDGETLVIGAPNAVSRDRIATRFLPAVREAIVATIGSPVGVSVVVVDEGGGVMGDG